MARQIKETPVLRGKCARDFEKEIRQNRDKKVSAEEHKRAMETYQKVKLKFNSFQHIFGFC